MVSSRTGHRHKVKIIIIWKKSKNILEYKYKVLDVFMVID